MKISNRSLLLIGASLYTCEGTQARTVSTTGQKIYAIEFTNKDPKVIRLFLEFIRRIINAEEERIKVQPFFYPDHDEIKLLEYWSEVTQIPLIRFNQTIRLKQKNAKYRPNPLGVIKIRYHHKEHFLKLQAIIDKIFV
jgi:hypothetical protein